MFTAKNEQNPHRTISETRKCTSGTATMSPGSSCLTDQSLEPCSDTSDSGCFSPSSGFCGSRSHSSYSLRLSRLSSEFRSYDSGMGLSSVTEDLRRKPRPSRAWRELRSRCNGKAPLFEDGDEADNCESTHVQRSFRSFILNQNVGMITPRRPCRPVKRIISGIRTMLRLKDSPSGRWLWIPTHGNSESHAGIGVTAAWPRQESGHANQTANLKLPTKRCSAVGIPPRSRVGGGQLDFPPMNLHNLSNNTQTKTNPVCRRRMPKLKHILTLRLGDSWPIIFNNNPRVNPLNSQISIWPSMVNWILIEVFKQPTQPAAIRLNCPID